MIARRINTVRNIVAAGLLWMLASGQLGCALDVGGLDCDDPGCKPPPELSSPNSYTCECTCKDDPTGWQGRVLASTDDAEEYPPAGSMSLAGSKLDLHNQLVGLRFPGVAIPPGAHIVSAYVQFTSATDETAPLMVVINGEASDNAAPFSLAAKDVSSRPFTQNSVSWQIQGWKMDAQGPEEMTPSLTVIIQEIVNRPGWADGNAIALMMKQSSGVGPRGARSFDAQPMNAPLLVVTYDDPNSRVVGPQAMPVCMPPALNANLDGTEPDQDAMQNDCQYRVGPTFAGLAAACNYPSQSCSCVAVAGSKEFADKCDQKCEEDPVDADCSDFDPDNDIVKATNAPGQPSVCMAHCPLTFGMFGKRSECQVEGMAQMSVMGETVQPAVRGTVQFRGAACPDGNCPVGMEYNLKVDDVRFETMFPSETFEELTGIGESIPGNEAFLERGRGSFAPGELVTSVRGRRGRTQQALTVGNATPVDVDVEFGGTEPTCAIHGAMIGGSDGAGAPTVALGIEIQGRIVNQPPTADAGPDQVVQCPAPVTLDGSRSSDPDANIAIYTWLRDGRAGHRVGARAVSTIEQHSGTETYVLRVIDERGQTDEDTTDVTVVDTAAPQVKCGVRTPIFTAVTRNMVDVGFSGVARDACEGSLPVGVDVYSDEASTMTTRDRKPVSDAEFSDGSLKLRQDRRADGDGRVYLIRVGANDSSGNPGVDCCTVTVPHDGSPTAMRSAEKQAREARTFCLEHQGAAPRGFFPVGAR